MAAAEPAADELRPGKRVRLQGLCAAPELNGVVGRLRAFHSDRGRWAVALPGSTVPKLLKPSNLEPLEAGYLDTANLLVDVLTDDVVLGMFYFLPGRALLDLGRTCSSLNERARGSAALWRSLCASLLGDALVTLHENAWRDSLREEEPTASFWQTLFRAGFEGRRFQFADEVRGRFPEPEMSEVLEVFTNEQLARRPNLGAAHRIADARDLTRALSASGHTGSTMGNRVVMVGGWRPFAPEDEDDLHVCVVDLGSMQMVQPRLAAASARPSRRLRHASCVVQPRRGEEALLVLGGCHDLTHKPCRGLDCLLLMRFSKPESCEEVSWEEVPATGDAPKGIWHHSAGAFSQGKKVIAFGGDIPRDDPEYVHIADRKYARHVYILDVAKCDWQRVATHGQVPAWRSLHVGVSYTSLSDGSERFIVMGGCEEELKIFSGGPPATMEGYSLNLTSFKWECGSKRRSRWGFTPLPRMRFTAERYGCHLLVYGGHGSQEISDEELYLTLNLKSLEWQCAQVQSSQREQIFTYTPAAVLSSGCLLGGVMFTRRGVQPVPKLEFLCLSQPESLD